MSIQPRAREGYIRFGVCVRSVTMLTNKHKSLGFAQVDGWARRPACDVVLEGVRNGHRVEREIP